MVARFMDDGNYANEVDLEFAKAADWVNYRSQTLLKTGAFSLIAPSHPPSTAGRCLLSKTYVTYDKAAIR